MPAKFVVEMTTAQRDAAPRLKEALQSALDARKQSGMHVKIELTNGTFNLIYFLLEQLGKAQALDPKDDPLTLIGRRVVFKTTTGREGAGVIHEYVECPRQWVAAYEGIGADGKVYTSNICLDRDEFQVMP